MLSLFRIIKFSFQDIARNFWLAAATITILILALLSVNILMTVRVISENASSAVQEKIDISLYVKPDVPEEQIESLRVNISQFEKVKSVVYVSKDEALQDFRIKYENNQEVLSALKELGQNPLSPSLIIIPNNFSEAGLLINELRMIDDPIIESRDFSDNTMVLSKIDNITRRINDIGLVIIAIFILTSVLVVYNTVRVAIYTHRQEIEIMRLVGASNSFIYLPYVFSAFIYSLFSIAVIVAVFYPFLSLLQPYLEVFFMGYNVNILNYFINNFIFIFGLQFLAILFINIVASLLAVRRYASV
jgi:cell division transport system permease protein